MSNGAPRALRAIPAAAVLVFMLALPGPATAVDTPRTAAPYTRYAELVTEIQAVAAAHPGIVRVFSIGRSYQGRELWAAKVSDNVAQDEAEPEVLLDGLHHGLEYLSLEQSLYALHLLADGYATNATVRRLVDTREVWIIFAVNPDALEYNLASYPNRGWRKNRQPTPGSSAIGTDLNRNYDYRWGCCGGSSSNPWAWNFRGPRPFSAPESQAVRDFVRSRVVNGRQQIRTHITFHTNGELVLWPYGYTRTDLPGDMSAADRAAFVAMGRIMAAMSRYKPQQSSDLYVTDGDQIDWTYGRYRIFSFTFELFPKSGSTADAYPSESVIARETARNRAAILYLIDLADCPYRASGTATRNCGPLYDDFEIARGWTTNPDGTDTATAGAWVRGNPAPTTSNGPKQSDRVVSGSLALVTGPAAGSSAGAQDLDGRSTVASPPITLPPRPGPLSFSYSFAHGPGSAADHLRVSVEDTASGTRTAVFERLGSGQDVDAAWVAVTRSLGPWGGRTIRIIVEATDGGPDSLVEAAIDDVRVEQSAVIRVP